MSLNNLMQMNKASSDVTSNARSSDGSDSMCDCGNCMPMSSRPESKCCHFYAGAREKMEEGAEPLDCITQHEGFSVNFTNIHVLQLALLEFVSLAGPLDDNEPIHKTYRHVAFRRFSRWIHGRLRKHDRRPIPSCVVTAIREHFPSEEVAGFKYYRPS
ncbi:P2X purinoceptor 7-like [Haliotis cracherodii]|uniref:P2X purinoceptor 7-like n=1 Tax=Haliotis cracherodii TaxID=6455 RepID=UPI0039E92EFD